jgi:hypothetical protein
MLHTRAGRAALQDLHHSQDAPANGLFDTRQHDGRLQTRTGSVNGNRVIAAATSVVLLTASLVRASRLGDGQRRDSSLPPPPASIPSNDAQAQLGS